MINNLQNNNIDINLNVIDLLLPIYQKHRYKVLYGGRASGKSIGIADFLITQAAFYGKHVLCCREYQSSIKDSVHKLLVSRINILNLNNRFKITDKDIKSVTGGLFVFKGLAKNHDNIRSAHDFDYIWAEEAENISTESWQVLIPTLRKKDSEIIISFNPSDENNTTYQRFVLNSPQDSIKIFINYYNNPFFPDVLLQEIEYDKKYNPEKFRHIWMGECKTMSNAVIFKDKFTVESFDLICEPHGFYFNGDRVKVLYGLDYGFSNDPLALIEMFFHNEILYINNELYGVNIDNHEIIKQAKEKMPYIANNKVYADNSQPNTSSYLRHKGLNVYSADKWSGCVEDRIQAMRSFKHIIIHSRCKNTAYEFKSYSYKVDKNTSKVLCDIIDKDNHTIDAIGYGLNDIIQNKNRQYNINPEIVNLLTKRKR